ncbi:MAG: nucleoside monophosphate kinase [Patescibacteria group bacterium]
MIIFLIGPPFSGKSSTAEFISKKYNIKYLRFKVLVDRYITENKKYGGFLLKNNYENKPYPPKISLDVLKTYFNSKDDYILDNYPKNIDELNYLKENYIDKEKVFVILVQTSKKVLLERISLRLYCKKCNLTFNSDDINRNHCPVCKNQLFNRKDDTIEIFLIRYNQYLKNKNELIKEYGEFADIIKIKNNTNNKEDLFKEIDLKLLKYTF